MAAASHRRASVPSALNAAHQLLGAFPLALFTAAFVTDVTYANTAQQQWANFSVWMIAGGLAGAVASAVLGIAETLWRRGRAPSRRLPWWHGIGTALVVVLAFVNALVHSRDAWTSVVPTGLVLSGIVAVLVIATSWSGYALQAREDVR